MVVLRATLGLRASVPPSSSTRRAADPRRPPMGLCRGIASAHRRHAERRLCARLRRARLPIVDVGNGRLRRDGRQTDSRRFPLRAPPDCRRRPLGRHPRRRRRTLREPSSIRDRRNLARLRGMRLTERFDRYQRRHPWAGYPIAVIYKFFDDQGTYLAALITFYGFLSLFPLLLLLSSILGF